MATRKQARSSEARPEQDHTGLQDNKIDVWYLRGGQQETSCVAMLLSVTLNKS